MSSPYTSPTNFLDDILAANTHLSPSTMDVVGTVALEVIGNKGPFSEQEAEQKAENVVKDAKDRAFKMRYPWLVVLYEADIHGELRKWIDAMCKVGIYTLEPSKRSPEFKVPPRCAHVTKWGKNTIQIGLPLQDVFNLEVEKEPGDRQVDIWRHMDALVTHLSSTIRGDIHTPQPDGGYPLCPECCMWTNLTVTSSPKGTVFTFTLL